MELRIIIVILMLREYNPYHKNAQNGKNIRWGCLWK